MLLLKTNYYLSLPEHVDTCRDLTHSPQLSSDNLRVNTVFIVWEAALQHGGVYYYLHGLAAKLLHNVVRLRWLISETHQVHGLDPLLELGVDEVPLRG